MNAVMPMTDNDKIEELLKNYRSIKSNIRTEAISKIPEYSQPAVDYSTMTPGEGNAVFSKVEDYVVKHELVNNQMRKLIKVRDIIKTAYESLTVEQKRIVKYLYFEEMNYVETSFKMKLSERTIVSRKKDILDVLKGAGIMRGWGFWEQINEIA